MPPCPNRRLECKGHKIYQGGIMDGHVACLTIAHSTDYPVKFGTALRNGQRSWYRRATDPAIDTDVTYEFFGLGRESPA